MTLEQYNVSHAKRQARNAEKTRLTLRWLREELCSTAELVARRLGIAAVQPVYRFPGQSGGERAAGPGEIPG